MLSRPAGQERAGTVVPFVSAADAATGKNRRIAAKAIARQLRKLSDSSEYTIVGSWPHAEARLRSLLVFFCKLPEGLYFRVHGGGVRRALMTGYIDPVHPGNYAELGLHVMSWRRGWERELFAYLEPRR